MAGAELPLVPGGGRQGARRAVAELDRNGRRHRRLGVEPRHGAPQLRLAAADHARGRLLPAGRLAPDAAAHRRRPAARPRPHHPAPGCRDQRLGGGLHSRSGRHLSDARPLLRRRPQPRRHRLWPPRRPLHRAPGLHPGDRLDARVHRGGKPRRRAVVAGPRAPAQGLGRTDQRHGHRRGLPLAALRRPEGRSAPRVADLRAVRVQLPVRARGHAGGGAAGGGHRRAGAVRRAALSRQLRLQGRPETPAADKPQGEPQSQAKGLP